VAYHIAGSTVKRHERRDIDTSQCDGEDGYRAYMREIATMTRLLGQALPHYYEPKGPRL